MYVALVVRPRTHFSKRKPAVGRQALVVRGCLLRVRSFGNREKPLDLQVS